MYRMCNFILILNIFMRWCRNLCADTACECYNFVKTSYTEENTMLYMLRSVTSALFSGHPTKDTKCDGIIPCVCICRVTIIIVFVVYYFFAYILELTFLLCVGILIAICFFIKTFLLSFLKSMLCHIKNNPKPIGGSNVVVVVGDDLTDLPGVLPVADSTDLPVVDDADADDKNTEIKITNV